MIIAFNLVPCSSHVQCLGSAIGIQRYGAPLAWRWGACHMVGGMERHDIMTSSHWIRGWNTKVLTWSKAKQEHLESERCRRANPKLDCLNWTFAFCIPHTSYHACLIQKFASFERCLPATCSATCWNLLRFVQIGRLMEFPVFDQEPQMLLRNPTTHQAPEDVQWDWADAVPGSGFSILHILLSRFFRAQRMEQLHRIAMNFYTL